jgi:hypothetical protein
VHLLMRTAAWLPSLPPFPSRTLQQSRYKPAAELYRQLRDLEQAVG